MNRKYGMIPFFIPHIGCPHMCTFCNQSRITGTDGIDHLTYEYIYKTIENYTGDHRHDKYWEVAFYGGSFSAISPSLQEALLSPVKDALDAGLIDGIRCSTRPDAVGDEALQRLRDFGVTVVELGVQSMNDRVLAFAKRGHSSQDVVDAVRSLRRFHMRVGLQVLPGLSGDGWDTVIETAVRTAALSPDFVRIYPVLVIEHTELADQYRRGEYQPLTLDMAVRYAAFLKTWYESHDIQVIRTGLQSTDELDRGASLLAGPYEPAFGELAVNEQIRYGIEHCIDAHRNAGFSSIEHIRITYPGRYTSKVRGLRNRNVRYMAKQYKHICFDWRESSGNTVCCIIDGLNYVL